MVADDELALAPAEREQRVHHYDPGLHRFGHEVALDDRRGRTFDRPARIGAYCAFLVERSAQRINDPPQQSFADRDADDLSGAEHRVARLDVRSGIQKHATDLVGVQHAGEPDLAALEP